MNWEPTPNADDYPGCLGCAHLRHGRRAHCAAYPDGLPFAIVSGQVDHLVPRPGQVGDTVFEPLDLQHWVKTRERRVLVEEPESTPPATPAEAR